MNKIIITVLACLLGGYMPAHSQVSWEKADINANGNLNKVYFFNKNQGFVTGENGLLLMTNDGGVNWNRKVVDPGKPDMHLKDIFFLNPDTGWLTGVGPDDGTYFTHDGGLNWHFNSHLDQWVNSFNPVNSVYWKNIDSGYYLTEKEMIMTTDGGNTYINDPLEHAVFIRAFNFYFVNDTVMFVFGSSTSGPSVLYSENGGYFFKPTDIGEQTSSSVYDMVFIDGKHGKAVGSGGKFYLNEGIWNTWERAPAFTNTTLRAVHFFDENTGLVAGNNGEIFITRDNGENWVAYKSVTTDALKSIFCHDDGTCWIAGDNGTLLKSTSSVTSAINSVNEMASMLIVYPNPNLGSVKLMNRTGRDIIKVNLLMPEGKHIPLHEKNKDEFTYDSSKITPGAYFLLIEITGMNHILKKIIVYK